MNTPSARFETAMSDLPLVGLAYLHVEQLLVPPGPWVKRERKLVSH